jgi:biopolymer transport protein ExbD
MEVASDGICKAAGLTAHCRDIGAKLHKAGVPSDTWISLRGDGTPNYKVMKSATDSLARAGFSNMKIGFITEPVH